MTEPGERITVAVCTYRRPKQLGSLLPMLASADVPAGAAVEVLVVDNDPAGSAHRVVSDSGAGGVRYVHEPRPGIAAARNAALTGSAGSDFIVFIDDDEEPASDWLVHLVATARRCSADGVAGPTYSRFSRSLPGWMSKGGFFDRDLHPTGTPITAAAAGNLLLRMTSVQRLNHRFDDRFGLTGGEDTDFTTRLTRSGAILVWCQEAATFEDVPADRIRAAWVLRRAFRSGNTTGRIALLGSSGAMRRGRVALGGLARVGVALPDMAVSLLWPGRHWATGLRRGLRGAGMLVSASGRVLVEYTRD